jgi:serine/threonine protein kinase
MNEIFFHYKYTVSVHLCQALKWGNTGLCSLLLSCTTRSASLCSKRGMALAGPCAAPLAPFPFLSDLLAGRAQGKTAKPGGEIGLANFLSGALFQFENSCIETGLCYNSEDRISASSKRGVEMSPLAAGQKFGRYCIRRYLGSGISGESYEAEDIALQRSVTLKLIHPWSFLPDSARRQFFREMQDICAFDHPSLVPLHDYGELNSRLFIARRYVDPGSLLSQEGRDWYRPPMALSHALQYADQLAGALMYAHNRGYLHGSLTLSNIFVLPNQQPSTGQQAVSLLISDLALAYFVRRFGKPPTSFFPATAAPEQLDGNTVPASDQYALAVLLYFWLTNRLPFVGTPEVVEQNKQSGTITSPSLIEPAITPEQSNIILRALSASPEDRYASMLHFTAALRASTQATAPHKEVRQTEGQGTQTPTLVITRLDEAEAREVKLTGKEISIGRAGSSDIFLPDDDASRHQAMIKFERGNYMLYDCRSVNGTTLNGQRLESEVGYILHHGDLIGIGTHNLTFILKDEFSAEGAAP